MRTIMISVAVICATAGCGGENDSAPNRAVTGGVDGSGSVAVVEGPDACTLFVKAELETGLGAKLRDGEPQSVAGPTESSCRFRMQLSPALPSSLGLTSVTISTSPVDPEAVAQIRELDPGAFDAVPGVGDDAYFLGPALLHVRVRNRGFSVRIEPEPNAPDDQAIVREVMLALGRAGASRL